MTAPDQPTLRNPARPDSRRAWGLAVLALACAAAPAWAQDPCEGAVTQLDLNDCTHAAWMAADEELNLAYGAALEAARQYDSWPEGRAEDTLRAAQRAWVAYRDAACEAEAALWDGGSAQPMILSGCLGRLTTQRTDDLWAYAEQ
jgi:uncharacterized protein YecT (DUF1311 family)